MNKQTKHTPGPWRLHKPNTFSPTIQDWTITSPIAPDLGTRARYTVLLYLPSKIDGNPLWEHPSEEELKANAHLIVAVTDLLVACEAVEQAQRSGDYEQAFKLVRNAINKATGS